MLSRDVVERPHLDCHAFDLTWIVTHLSLAWIVTHLSLIVVMVVLPDPFRSDGGLEEHFRTIGGDRMVGPFGTVVLPLRSTARKRSGDYTTTMKWRNAGALTRGDIRLLLLFISVM